MATLSKSSNYCAETLSFLKWFETHWKLDISVKDKFQTLRLKMILLEAFFSPKRKWHTDDKNLQVHLWHINQVLYHATKNFILSKGKCWTLQEKLCGIISGVIKKLDMAIPHIRQICALVSKSRRSTCSTANAMIELIHMLLEKMENLLSWKVQSFLRLSKQMEELEEDLRYLRNFLRVTEIWCNKDEILKDLLTHAGAVAYSTACILFLCTEESKMDVDIVNEMKGEVSCVVQKIKPFQPNVREIYIKALKALESSLQDTILVDETVLHFLYSLLGHVIDLSKVKASFRRSVIDQIEALHKELQIMRDYLFDPSASQYNQSNEKANNVLLHIKDLLFHAAYAIYTPYDTDISKEMAEVLNLTVADLFQEIEDIKQEARDVYDEIIAKSLRSNFPRTNELGFMDFVIQNLHELLSSKAGSSVLQLQHQMETVLGSILSLREDVFEIKALFAEQKEERDLWLQFINIVYHTEFVIDSFTARSGYLWDWKLGLFDIMEQIHMIRSEVNAIKITRTTDTTVLKNLGCVSSLENSGNSGALQDPSYEVGNETKKPIGHVDLFVDAEKKIREQLTSKCKDLCILSIVGMPGIGKTTLGNSIYENRFVRLCFHARARCHVGHACQKRRLLLDILQQVCGETDQVCGRNDDDLAEKLYQSLKGKKYFIFLDDLWDLRPWNDMRACFPDDKKGSRIMFTSRFQNIALETGMNTVTYPLTPISDSRTWELLQIKLFGKESCPPELVKVGQKIAAECKGLTLAADLIAGLLRTMASKNECWAQVANSLNTHLLEDQDGRCMHILELSYNQLPDHLKPSFLYFGAFPGNREVPTSKLMWLWIAEGFVKLQNGDEGSPEDVARSYLNDLIARSLVIDSKRGSSNGVKASCVHDLMHDFALAKAKEECFFQQQTCAHSRHVSSHVQTLYEPYRLCIYSEWECFKASMPFGPRLRSLLSSDFSCSCPFENFKLLRVLDLSGTIVDLTPCIFQLVHLRFLSVCTSSTRIPWEISYLQNLETLLLRSRKGIQLPDTVWKLVRLRHFRIDWHCFLPRYNQEFMEKTFKFNSLQTLSTPCLFFHEDLEKTMRGLPNLRKLSCIFLDSWDHSFNCNRFPVLDFLTQLESLHVVYGGQVVRHPCEFNFPHNLKKLKLSKFRLPWSAVSAIGKLPNLEVLKLLHASFEGKTWDMKEGEFLKLKFLKLESLDIAHWNASEDHLPCLETLVVKKCYALIEIPLCLGDIPTLQRIELQNCTRSAWISARTVKEKQKEMGNDQFEFTFKFEGSWRVPYEV
ncbi:putative late blight resistance protein homolog R1A-3 [Coffea arabica]|uniref:Late blight resistance protein homolog R1A-3 n=1 Tax=Coffea arabica TaxID=13443 RepID=A0A6P6V8K7_COFAR|nr:putative late blight resistance protein homolog R1A-3 [Coffea arabica]